jgi:hypothetical protein
VSTNDEYMSLEEVRAKFVPRDEYADKVRRWAALCESTDLQKNAAYKERDACVALIAKMAVALEFKAGLGRHDENDQFWDGDWMNIVFIELPNGQLSWHVHDSEMHLFEGLPKYEGTWDGHTTPEKYTRMEETTVRQLQAWNAREMAKLAEGEIMRAKLLEVGIVSEPPSRGHR